jgi:RHS repeat-associated protein
MGLQVCRLRALACLVLPRSAAAVGPRAGSFDVVKQGLSLGSANAVLAFDFFLALLMVASLLGAGHADAQELSPTMPVDDQIRVSYSGLVPNRATNTFDTVATLTNIGTTPVFAPMSLVVTTITPASVQLGNAAGTTAAGLPYVNLPLTGGSLNPGATLTSIVLKFSNPRRIPFTFTQSIYGVVGSSNRIPTANAGPDQTVAAGATVALDGTQSTDIDGNALTYRWSFVSIPGGSHALLANPTAVNPDFVADKAGEYTVQLIANDGQADSLPTAVVITTVNSRPVADAGPDQLVASGTTIHLDGTHSTDLDGDPLTYRWNFVSVPAGSQATLDAPTAVNPSFFADKPGVYQARLVVNDGRADSHPATVTISTQSVVPIARPGLDQAVSVQANVQLDGSKSVSANGAPLTYRWALITLAPGSSAALVGPTSVHPTFVVDKPGIYVAQLIVNDGQTDSAPRVVVITTGNVRPVADAGASQAAQAGQTVVLDGTGSRDANGDALSFAWSLLLKPASSAAVLTSADRAQASLTCDVPGIFVAQLIVSDDELDSFPTTTTVTVTVAPPNHDPQITSAAATTAQVGAAYSYQVAASDPDGDPLTYTLSVSSPGMTISASGLVGWNPSSAGAFPVTVRVTDGRGGSATQTYNIVVSGSGLPPDPSSVAPPLDPTVAGSTFAATAFLYSGTNPIQIGVAPGTIDSKRVSILRGKVSDSTGAALTGVAISIVGHAEFGQTLSRLDGMFDMAANGGGHLTVRYAKAGYLPAQRQVQTNWQEYTVLPDVVLLPRDSRVTTIDFGAGLATMQVARGSVQRDGDGSRQATVLFPAGTTAALVQADGSTAPAGTLNVRFTEYTVGVRGPQAMPGDLPPTSAYTYAVELGADEAVAKVKGRDVVFNQPVIFYVENFMHVAVGQIVPVGFYDPNLSTWIGAPNGRVINVLGASAGMANIDADGDGVADTAAALAALGITTAERQQLAALYGAGTSLWRTPMDHFSTNDQNWSFVCVPTDCGPPKETPPPQPPPDQCTQGGSIIGCERQTLGKNLELVGTPFTLHYESERVPGRTAEQGLLLSLASKGVPTGVKSIQVEILVAGQKLTQTVPTSSGVTTFAWDGKDAYGRSLNGSYSVTTRVGYTYDIVASAAITVPSSWARFSGIPLSVNSWRTQITLYQENTTQITRQDQRGLGLGGWSLNVLHAYDPSGHVLNLGDGTRRNVDLLTANVVRTMAGDGTAIFGGDGVAAIKSGISTPAGITVGPDGSVYIVDNNAHRVTRVDPNGISTTLAGTGTRGFGGDGGPANVAQLANPTSVALGLDGSMYIVDRSNFRVRRVAPNGVISTFAGTGIMGGPVEGSLADATPIFPRNVAVGPDGRVFISDAKHIWVVDQNGVINAYAGASVNFGGDGGPALQAGLASPSGMAFSSDGTLFFVDNDRVRKVTPQGIISTVAGPGNGAFSGDGGPATSAGLEAPRDITVGRDGSFYIAATNRVRRVGSDGIITTFAGNGAAAPFADGGPGPQTTIATANGLAVGPDQAAYVADAGHHRIRRVASALPGVSATDLLVASSDGTELYVFTGDGRHLRTINALTGTTLAQFAYDTGGYVVSVTDGDGNVTTIQRTGALPTAIVAPGGQRTTLATNADGWLSSLTNPAGQSRRMTYSAGGLLLQLADPRGNASRYTYDSLGRLVKDEDPVGGSVSLVRTEQTNGYVVTTTSALGRTRIYQVQQRSDGSLARTLTSPNGLKTSVVTRTDGSETTTDAGGTVSSVTYRPDPRWGMLSPIANTVVTTPSGLARVTTITNAATLANPADPLSLTSFQDTLTVNGSVSLTVFDAASRRATATTPVGRSKTVTTDSKGRVIQEQIGGLAPITYSYNTIGQIGGITENNGARTTAFVYSSGHELQSITNAVGQSVSFEHDLAGRTTTQRLPDGATISYAYDAGENLTGITPPGKAAHSFDYTAANQTASYAPPPIGAGVPATQYRYDLDGTLARVDRPDGRHVDLSYDSAGRVNALSIARGQLAYAYHPVDGTLASITAPGGVGLSFSYDGPLLTSVALTGPIAGTASFTYDKNFRVIAETVNGAAGITLGYDGDGLLTSAGSLTMTRDPRNGLMTRSTLESVGDTYAYNGVAELVSHQASASGAIVYSETLVRDGLGWIAQKLETIGGTTTSYAYGYDAAGRLATVAVNGATTATYAYDSNGNRTSVSRAPAGPLSATFDSQDRLVAFGNVAYTYTNNGELQSRSVGGQLTSYQYDELGNLVAVTLPGGGFVEYIVDGMNRRIGKKVNGATIQGFLYRDGLRPVAEVDGAGSVISRFVYADASNVPAYFVKAGATYRIITDQLNSPRLVVNAASGAVVQRIDYDEFGVVTSDTNPGFQPFGFGGGIYDRDTRFVHFGARDYDAETGRWTVKDPLGFKAGDTNQYAYAQGNPVTFTDPTGLADEDATIECRVGQYQVVPGWSKGDINEDCTKQHEEEHIKLREEVFGKNSCAGVTDGTLPHGDQSLFGMEGMKYQEFIDWTEARAQLVDTDCQKKKLDRCGKNDPNKKALKDRFKADKTKLSQAQKKVPMGKWYPGFGDINSRM